MSGVQVCLASGLARRVRFSAHPKLAARHGEKTPQDKKKLIEEHTGINRG